MSRQSRDPGQLALQLQSCGAASSNVLASQLGVSQPTLSRLITELGPRVERLGTGRNTRYALRRDVRQHGNHWPIYRVPLLGRPNVWGTLRSLHRGFRFVPQETEPEWMKREYPAGLSSGLPFFLEDIRPQGYLGRAVARHAAALFRLPPDPLQWEDDDVLSYFLVEGDDLPGDLIVGDDALERLQRVSERLGKGALLPEDRASSYPQLVDAVQRGEVAGSSAGGEQPKILATVRHGAHDLRSVLVKFSPAEQSSAGLRWADLLVTESLALDVLRAHGFDSARTEILDAGGRRFLEVERFDRTDGFGRRGVITLGTLEDAFLDRSSNDWAEAAGLLREAGWVDEIGARALRWVWCFGGLIANTDMHRANASFWFRDRGPFQLAPFYDMLPMLYRPNAQGEIVRHLFEPSPPRASVGDVWGQAGSAALEFWGRVASDERITPEFRQEVAGNREVVNRLLERYA